MTKEPDLCLGVGKIQNMKVLSAKPLAGGAYEMEIRVFDQGDFDGFWYGMNGNPDHEAAVNNFGFMGQLKGQSMPFNWFATVKIVYHPQIPWVPETPLDGRP